MIIGVNMKKKFLLSVIIVSLLCLTILVGCGPDYNENAFYPNKPASFKVRDDGTFVVMQITDTHLQDHMFGGKTTIDMIAKQVTEQKPDLVVATGDIVTPSSHNPKAASAGLKAFAAKMDSLKQYWALVYGNHDIEDSNLTNDMIQEIMSKYEYALFFNDPDSRGYTDFSIDILDNNSKVLHSLIMMDTLANADTINEQQIKWYEDMVNSKTEKSAKGEMVNSTLFMHIPVPAFKTAWEKKQFISNDRFKIPTLTDEDKVYTHTSGIDNGFFDKVVSLGSTGMINVGHDHNFNWLAKEQGVYLHYGRVSGKDAWGKFSSTKIGVSMITIDTTKTTFDEIYSINTIVK